MIVEEFPKNGTGRFGTRRAAGLPGSYILQASLHREGEAGLLVSIASATTGPFVGQDVAIA